MTPKYLWLAALVALYISPIQSLNCVHLDQTIWENMKLLSTVLTTFPLRCLKDITDFEFPKEILPYIQHMKKDTKAVSHHISSLALIIFSLKESTSLATEEHLDRIRSGLFKQVRQARECVEGEENENAEKNRTSQHPHSEGFKAVRLELSKYFFRIKKFLVNKKYSFCAWKIAVVEIRRCFIIFYKFKKLLNMNAESSSFKQVVTAQMSPRMLDPKAIASVLLHPLDARLFKFRVQPSTAKGSLRLSERKFSVEKLAETSTCQNTTCGL